MKTVDAAMLRYNECDEITEKVKALRATTAAQVSGSKAFRRLYIYQVMPLAMYLPAANNNHPTFITSVIAVRICVVGDRHRNAIAINTSEISRVALR
jgi:hypothetical protein